MDLLNSPGSILCLGALLIVLGIALGIAIALILRSVHNSPKGEGWEDSDGWHQGRKE